MQVANRTVFIAGGGGGMGQAFTEAGARIVLATSAWTMRAIRRRGLRPAPIARTEAILADLDRLPNPG